MHRVRTPIGTPTDKAGTTPERSSAYRNNYQSMYNTITTASLLIILRAQFYHKNLFHISTFFVYVCIRHQVGGRKSRLLFTYIFKFFTIMPENDMISAFVRNYIKPVIMEAIAEAGAMAAQRKEKRYYTREEACKLLHIGTTTFYRLAGKGKITILKLEGKTLVDADELEEAIETKAIFRYQH